MFAQRRPQGIHQPGFDFYLDLTYCLGPVTVRQIQFSGQHLYNSNISSFLTDFPLITFLLMGSSGNATADPLMDQEPICTDFTLTFFALVVFVFDVIDSDS